MKSRPGGTRVSKGSVVTPSYGHITHSNPLTKLSERQVADMSPEDHSGFVPSEGQPLRLHQQMAGQKAK